MLFKTFNLRNNKDIIKKKINFFINTVFNDNKLCKKKKIISKK